MEEIEFIDRMIARLRTLKATIKKKEKLSQRAFEMDFAKNTQKQMQKANVDLNWQCMHLDKEKTDFARAFKGSILDVDTGKKEYNPSGFHSYKG